MKCSEDKFKKFGETLELDFGERYKDRFLSELESTGLITKTYAMWMIGTPYITDTGLDFLEWLRASPE